MSSTVHVCKTYKIEYGETSRFNWKSDKFYDLLQLLGGEPNSSDGDGNSYADNFECSKEDYDDAIRNLQAYIADPNIFKESDGDDNEDGEQIDAILTDMEMTPNELLDTMQRYRKEADVNDGYLHFSVF